MDWMKIIWALAIIAMMAAIFPRLRHSMKDSKKGTSSDWLSVVIPLGLVVLFVIILIKMV